MKSPIETERLILRELLESDAEKMFEMDSNPNVHIFVGKKALKHINETHEHIRLIQQQYKDFGTGRWAVVLKGTGEFIGWSGIKFITSLINKHQNFYEIGYRFNEKYWGKGFATESGKALIDYAFNTMRIEAVYAYADEDNENSRNVLEKLGLKYINSFEYEGETEVWYELKNPKFY
jgi:ribosomal-protein-alanine N-acetyltransferase